MIAPKLEPEIDRSVAAARLRRLLERTPPRLRTVLPALAALVIGLVVGLTFALPVLVYRWTAPGQRQVLLLVLVGLVAILFIRRSSRLLRVLLDSAPQPWRLPLLGLWGLAAMSMLAALTLN